MVNQHSKNVTTPQFEIQLHIALQWDLCRKVIFLERNRCAHYLKHDTSGTLVAFWGLSYDSYRAG